VPPNTYVVIVTAAGFTSIRKESVILLVNSPVTLDFALKVGKAETMVDVSGEAPTVNTVDATLGNAFNSKQIQSLPQKAEMRCLIARICSTNLYANYGRRCRSCRSIAIGQLSLLRPTMDEVLDSRSGRNTEKSRKAPNIWIAVIGPDTKALGERTNHSVTQAEIAATVAELLGKDFRKAVPEAAPPIADVISQPSK
jgi:hypothetical protein